MWKLLSGIIAHDMETHLDKNHLIPCEQKGCAIDRRGTKDLLLTDKAIVKNCKRRKTNLEMVWVDYKKAYDRVPHSWIIECMNMYKVNSKIIAFHRERNEALEDRTYELRRFSRASLHQERNLSRRCTLTTAIHLGNDAN